MKGKVVRFKKKTFNIEHSTLNAQDNIACDASRNVSEKEVEQPSYQDNQDSHDSEAPMLQESRPAVV